MRQSLTHAPYLTAPTAAASLGSKCTIFVNNLPWSVDHHELGRIFSSVAGFRSAEVAMRGGRSRGFGTVTFDTPANAATAINTYNGATVDDRVITVREDRN
jgi:RNA recognition motif-containing protein